MHVPVNERDYYTQAEVAELAQVSMPTLRRDIRAGRLRAYRVSRSLIRIRKSDADRYVRGEPIAPEAEAAG